MRVPQNDGDFEYLQEEVVSLAEDIVDLDESYGELDSRISMLLSLMGEMSKACLSMVDVIKDQDCEINNLKHDQATLDNAWFRWLMITTVWLLILTGWMIYNVLV